MSVTQSRSDAELDETVVELQLIDETGLPSSFGRGIFWIVSPVVLALMIAFGVATHLLRVSVTIEAIGTVEPQHLWSVRSTTNGKVNRVLVRLGDTVQRGQIVAELDTLEIGEMIMLLRARLEVSRLAIDESETVLPLELRRADETRSRAEARVLRARASVRDQFALNGVVGDVDSALRLYKRGTHVAIDMVLAELQAADADILSAKTESDRAKLTEFETRRLRLDFARTTAELRLAKERQNRLTLRAPAFGTVLTEHLERLPGVVVRDGEPLLEIADLTRWRATLLVSERDAQEIHRGDSAMLDIPALDWDKRHRLLGTVDEVAEAPFSTEETPISQPNQRPGSKYRVLVNVESVSPDHYTMTPRLGYSVRAHIITRSVSVATLIGKYLRRRLAYSAASPVSNNA